MKAHYRAFGGRLVIEIEGDTIKSLFQQIGPVAEVLDADNACGKCSSPNIYPRARTAQGFDFYELVCSDCGAKLSFGQNKAGGGLFPKRVDEHGNRLDHRGWHVYHALEAPKEPAQKAAPPKQTSQRNPPAPPKQAEIPDERLKAFISRMENAKSVEEQDEVFVEVCEAISDAYGQQRMQSEWKQALAKYGDPATKPGTAVPVLKYLYSLTKAKAA